MEYIVHSCTISQAVNPVLKIDLELRFEYPLKNKSSSPGQHKTEEDGIRALTKFPSNVEVKRMTALNSNIRYRWKR